MGSDGVFGWGGTGTATTATGKMLIMKHIMGRIFVAEAQIQTPWYDGLAGRGG